MYPRITLVFILTFLGFLIPTTLAYTSPSYDNIDLVLEGGYSSPNYSNINLVLGEDTNSPPNKPILNYPTNGSTGIELNPTLNVTVSDPDGDNMNVSFINNSDHSVICQNNSISNNTEVTCTWSGLSEVTTYNWYVNVTDNNSQTTTSQTWNFTTESAQCWIEEQGKLIIPPGCKYYTNVKEGISPI